MMVIETKFNIGQEVYLKTDNEQLKRIVKLYQLSQGTEFSTHESFEITSEKDVLITSTN